MKACLDVLIKPITDIINASLCSGLFPEDFKCAHVNPILKKTTLPKEKLKNQIFWTFRLWSCDVTDPPPLAPRVGKTKRILHVPTESEIYSSI